MRRKTLTIQPHSLHREQCRQQEHARECAAALGAAAAVGHTVTAGGHGRGGCAASKASHSTCRRATQHTTGSREATHTGGCAEAGLTARHVNQGAEAAACLVGGLVGVGVVACSSHAWDDCAAACRAQSEDEGLLGRRQSRAARFGLSYVFTGIAHASRLRTKPCLGPWNGAAKASKATACIPLLAVP